MTYTPTRRRIPTNGSPATSRDRPPGVVSADPGAGSGGRRARRNDEGGGVQGDRSAASGDRPWSFCGTRRVDMGDDNDAAHHPSGDRLEPDRDGDGGGAVGGDRTPGAGARRPVLWRGRAVQ